MSGLTKIEWADAVWNPVTGCTKVSAGCAHCYAERMATRLAGRAGYPAQHPFALTLHPERLDEPLHWRKPRRIFVCSMSDLFHPDVPVNFVDQVFAVMLLAPRHTFLVLTKRPGRMVSYTNQRVVGQAEGFTYGDSIALRAVEIVRAWPERLANEVARRSGPLGRAPWPLPNVWLGTSIEDQATADERIPHLLRCPAAVRFVSYEPALGPVGLHSLALSGAKPSGFIDALGNQSGEFSFQSHRIGDLPSLDWVIAGGESGPRARPAHPGWFRSVRDQCQAAGVPFFFKQAGEWTWSVDVGFREPDAYVWIDGRVGDEATAVKDGGRWQGVWRVGKKAAGRLLDGVEHNAYLGEATLRGARRRGGRVGSYPIIWQEIT